MPNRTISQVLNGRAFPALPEDHNVQEAAVMMREWKQSAILILKDQRITGILTERDIVFKVIATQQDPATTKIADVMTRQVTTISPDKPFGHAMHLMYEGGFRHVPVVNDNGTPVGIITSQDALDIETYNMVHELSRREEIAVIL